MKRFAFNWRRFRAIVGKEYIQMRRDRVKLKRLYPATLLSGSLSLDFQKAQSR